jgi:RNA polymerase sigma factor (sigma-70 family)
MNVQPPGAERAALKDRRLVHRLRHGDTDALHQVYHRYRDDLLTVAMSLLNDRYAAEDCVHDVFVHFAADPADLRATKNLRGYLLRCVANRAKNLIKRRQLQPTSPGDEQADGLGGIDPGLRGDGAVDSLRAALSSIAEVEQTLLLCALLHSVARL